MTMQQLVSWKRSTNSCPEGRTFKVTTVKQTKILHPKARGWASSKSKGFFSFFCIYNFINSGNVIYVTSYMYTLMSGMVSKQIKQASFF